MFIFINIPCWDIQCSPKECENITHSIIGHYLAGNIGNDNIQCSARECANILNVPLMTLITYFEDSKVFEFFEALFL